MNKVISLILIVLLFTLSGCGEESIKPYVEEEINDYIKRNNEDYYTQEEVDFYVNDLEQRIRELESEIIRLENNLEESIYENTKGLMDVIYSMYVEYDEFNQLLLSNCEIVDGIKECKIVININENYGSIE